MTSPIVSTLRTVSTRSDQAHFLAFDAVPFVSAGAWCLLAATLLDAVNVVRILRHAFVRPNASRESHHEPVS